MLKVQSPHVNLHFYTDKILKLFRAISILNTSTRSSPSSKEDDVLDPITSLVKKKSLRKRTFADEECPGPADQCGAQISLSDLFIL